MLQIIDHSAAKVLFLGHGLVGQYKQFRADMTTVEKVHYDPYDVSPVATTTTAGGNSPSTS